MKRKFFFSVNDSKNFVHLVVHFMKWSVDFLSISRNGQIFCLFHEIDSWVVHFMKWKFPCPFHEMDNFTLGS